MVAILFSRRRYFALEFDLTVLTLGFCSLAAILGVGRVILNLERRTIQE